MKRDLFICAFTIVISLITCFIYSFINNPLSAEKIFMNSITKVVEVKAITEEYGTSYGTGVLIDENATILTNAHVVSYQRMNINFDFEELSIRFAYEDEYRLCEIIKIDYEIDLAVMKIVEDENLEFDFFTMNENKILAGATVYAIGNSNNFGIGITMGICASSSLTITYNNISRKVIQSDVYIASGNSGGALVDSSGNLIGITTFKINDSNGDQIQGLCYSIAIEEILKFMEG
ncbi:MAG: serine protease [Mycoplasmatota bacterium]